MSDPVSGDLSSGGRGKLRTVVESIGRALDAGR